MRASGHLISSSRSPTVKDALSVGGKAASLFRLLDLGFPVPTFFVLTAEAYRRNVGGKLGELERAEVCRALEALDGDAFAHAVRSSGLAEDSADFSYAGVFDTFLDVRGARHVIEAIERCWASHKGATAAAYRARRGVVDDVAMAVVVQRMVHADWAGVSFSADPVTQALSVCVINATRGLGEKLVSGHISPEEIRLDLESGRILERKIPQGAEPMPDWLRSKVLEVTRHVAQRMDFPQDLEWAAEGRKLFLLQSRPITTIAGVFHNRALESWAGHGNPDAPDRVWTRAYADEIWTPPVSPLFYDIQNLTLATAQRLERDGDRAPTPPDTFKYYRAAPYMDAAVLERMYAGLPPIARRRSLLPLLPPERREALLRAPWHGLRYLRRIWQFEIVKGKTWGLTRNHRFLERSWSGFLDTARSLCDVDLTKLSEEQLAEHLGKIWSLALSVGPECEIAVLYYAHDIMLMLSGLLERWCGASEERYGEVSAGLENSQTVREAQAIWNIAASVRVLGPAAIESVRSCDSRTFRAVARGIGAQSVVDQFDTFLRDHRHRGANYKDLIHPRWGNDPELLWAHVQAFIEADSPPPAQTNAASGARRREAQRASLASVRGPLAQFKRAILRALFRSNEIYAGLRDNHRFYYDYVWWLVRCLYGEIGMRLHAQGKLASANEVFFLVRREIDALREGSLDPATAAERIAVRRREWEETRKNPPARFLRRAYVPDAVASARPQAGQTLRGLAASSGQAVGRARVVYDVTGLGRVTRGDILVTRQTDPGWTPAFTRLGGLVLETGGVLAHGASLCREYGLPCVTAIDEATSLIGDGDLISVSGGEGVVEIVEKAPTTAITADKA